MTKQKDLKRRIRERMQRTGESYTTARLHVLAHHPQEANDPTERWSSLTPPPAHPGSPPAMRLRRPVSFRLATRPRDRRAPHLRYVAPLFTVVLCLVVGMTGLLLVEESEGAAPTPEAPSVPVLGGPS